MKNKSRTPLEVINELESSGDLNILVKAGFCNAKVISHLEIFRYVDARTHTGMKNGKAVTEAATVFEVCRQQVYNIVRVISGYKK